MVMTRTVKETVRYIAFGQNLTEPGVLISGPLKKRLKEEKMWQKLRENGGMCTPLLLIPQWVDSVTGVYETVPKKHQYTCTRLF